jgi:DNA invertase Pin-like site-specific DNA recombinase
LVVVISLCSVCFKIAHAEKGLVPSAIAAAPPILLFLAFESLLRQFGQERPAAPAKRKLQAKVLPLAKKALPLASVTKAGAKRAKALELAGEGLSQAAVARQLGVSAATVSRWLGKGSKAA